jgi:hypothetical protein
VLERALETSMNDNITEQEVLENIETILIAIRRHRTLATELAHLLAAQLGVDVLDFRNRLFHHIQLYDSGKPSSDYLDNAEWCYTFHGGDCRFTHVFTGQEVEVIFGYDNEFGVLDPGFFAFFINTTADLAHLQHLLGDFHLSCKTFDFLQKHGYLTEITMYEQAFYTDIRPQKKKGLVLALEYR